MVKYILPESILKYLSRFEIIGDYYSGTSLEIIVSEIHKNIFGVSFCELPLDLGGRVLGKRKIYS